MALPSSPRDVSAPIDAVEVRGCAFPLLEPFRAAHGTTTHRNVVLVCIEQAGMVGWGECGADTAPSYVAEFNDAVRLVLVDHLLPRLLDGAAVHAGVLSARLAGVKGHRMAKAVLETALLDAELRRGGQSLAARLGGNRPAVVVGVAVGLGASVDAVVAEVAQRVDEGYRRVKLKIAPGFDLEPVRAVRAAFPGLMLQVDANGAYDPADPAPLRALDDLGLLLIEQPFGDDDLVAHRDLARAIATPVCLDEAIRSIDHCRSALALGAAQVINVKPARVGGYLAAVAIHDLCRDAGVDLWCGGLLETGIGRAGNLALASLPGFTLPGDISASNRYWVRDVTEPFVLQSDGTLRVPNGPGLGVEVDAGWIDAHTQWVQRCTRAGG